MQALNLQIVNPKQEQDVSVKKISAEKTQGSGSSFREMLASASAKESAEPSVKQVEEKSSVKPQKTDFEIQDEKYSTELPPEAAFSFLTAAAPDTFSFSPDNENSFYDMALQMQVSDEDMEFLGSDDNALFADGINFEQAQIAFFPPEEAQELQAAQNLSVESPLEFLDDMAESVKPEVQEAAFVQLPQEIIAAAENLSVPEQTAFSADDKNKNPGFFKMNLGTQEKNSSAEAPSLFEGLFTVTDERTVEQKIADFKSELESGYQQQDNSLNLSLTLSENARQDILSTNGQTAGATGSTFQQMLSQQIQFNAPDFARAGSIVLHDNNSGSINMVLKPENLGNVKINLHLSDNVITGQITVNSKEAFEAFKQNMETLRQAFQNSGFENAALSLSYADTSSGSFAQGERQQSGEQFFSNKVYGEYASSAEISASAPQVGSYSTDSDRKVSVVA
ncbi:flagellar hook-length control protein FliK [Treponema sp.]|uniref:flagellar hook-length control protein FliK n=1 Tax=Treponema sp. TaxID=166 RepID=UPI003F04E0F9